jgi:S1-C subfamily serine protease
VIPSGAAAAAGARVGDRIVSIGDISITNDDSFGALRARYAGTTAASLPLVVRRAGEIVTLQVPVRLAPRMQTTVKPIPNAPEKAVRIRNGIMKGTTS